jgi:hypothetical protein
MKLPLRIRIKTFFWAIQVYLWNRIWWSFTQRITKRDVPLPTFTSPREIVEHLDYGRKYISDPRLDIMYHATHSERHLLSGNKASMDCDDHAVYWAQAMIRSNLAKSVWIGTFRMRDAKGKVEGHALLVYRDFDGTRRWADYDVPRDFEDDWDWARQSAAVFGCEMVGAAVIEVRGVTKDGRIKFGRVRVHRE